MNSSWCRVAGLKRRIDTGIAVTAASGLSPRQQLRAISEQAHRLQNEHAHYVTEKLLPALADEHIVLLSWGPAHYHRAGTSLALLPPAGLPRAHAARRRPRAPVPYISGNSLNLAVLVENPNSGKSHFARVKIPGNMPRLVPVDDLTDEESREERFGFITMENLIIAHLESLFPGMIIKEARSFRVTRNEDIDVEEDDAENLLNAMEKELLRRRLDRRSVWRSPTRPARSSPSCSPTSSASTRKRSTACRAPLDFTVLFDLQLLDRPGPSRTARSSRPRTVRSPKSNRAALRTSSPRSASATSCCTTPTIRSPRRCRRSSPKRPPTRACWPSSRRCTASAPTRRSSTR